MAEVNEKFGSDLANMTFNFLSEEPLSCIFCSELFIINHDIQPILKHLLELHKFVIGAPEEVADFRHYVLYWRKLQFTSLEDYCIVYITNTEDGAKVPQEKFYLLCDKLPEDKHFRMTLRQMKLNFVTHQKEEEYRDKDFSRQCIYCSAVIGGGISNSFRHLTFDHGFSIGNPDNIVFGAKLLDIMDNMLQRLQCLQCEKTFKNHISLRGHMRKKHHRSLNPQNKQYDKFYLRNYLKPGMAWEDAKKSILEEKEGPALLDPDTNDIEEAIEEEQLWMDWREDMGGIPASCLFCPFTTTKISTLLHHMEDNHHFHLKTLSENFNFYSKVKLINFIRTKVGECRCPSCDVSFESSEALLEHIAICGFTPIVNTRLWDSPGYLIPYLENDGLLIHLDDNDIDDEDSSSIASSVNDEIVLPEDAIPMPSILNDWRLREELSVDWDGNAAATATGDCGRTTGAVYKCFFCSFTMGGFGGRNLCINHMVSMHGFDYKEEFRTVGHESKIDVINYIRAHTDLGKCFVCGIGYITKGALEEHRILEGHTYLPPSHLYEDPRWQSRPTVVNDGFKLKEFLASGR